MEHVARVDSSEVALLCDQPSLHEHVYYGKGKDLDILTLHWLKVGCQLHALTIFTPPKKKFIVIFRESKRGLRQYRCVGEKEVTSLAGK
jgi:hypothetical protein